jgi:DNA-directed RNA polymerase specialized sigma24 family protein
MAVIDPQTFEQLKLISEKEWGLIFKELVIYSELRLTKIGFVPRTEKDVKNGEDFANDAIEKLFNGDRAWDFIRFPDVLIHLKGVAKSLIWSHIKSSSRSTVKKELTSIVFDDSEDFESYSDIAAIEDPETIIISDENWKDIENQFGEDSDGFIMFCDWVDEVPAREIAKEYNVDVTAVYNTIKKGKRIITKIFTI